MNTKLFLLCSALALATPLFGRDKSDVLVMKNGDHITCEIKGLDSDTLYIKIDYILSTLSVDWSKVDHIDSKQLFIVKTEYGLVYSGAISIPETPGGRPVKLEVLEAPDKLISLEKAEVITLDQTSTSFWQRLNGEIGMGLSYTKGNNSTQYNLNSSMYYPAEHWGAGASYNSNLSSNSGISTTTRNQLDLTAQRLMRWENWYYAGYVSFMQSSEQGIRLQSTFGGGIGRYLKNTGRTEFAVTGGLAWQRINYHEAILAPTNESVTSGMLGADLKLFYFDKTTLKVSATLLPALSNPGRIHLMLNTSYYVKLWSNLKWNISLNGNWDNRPPAGFSGSDYGTSSGVTWTFGNHR